MTTNLNRLHGAVIQRSPRWLALSYLWLIGVRQYRCAHLSEADVTCISFDAFETLLIRPVLSPGDVFLLCGRLLQNKNLTTISPEQWSQLRIESESELRKASGGKEIRLADIYIRIAQQIDDPTFDPDIALAIEVSTEKRLIKPVWETFSALQRAGESKTTIILSDTYFDQDDLQSILTNTRMLPAATRIIASSRTGARKYSGCLFKQIFREQSFGTGKILHVGDHLYSDVYQARAAGFRPAPYLGSSLTRYEKLLAESNVHPFFLKSAIAGSARSARLRTKFSTLHERNLADVSAGVTAPLLLAYVSWVLNRALALRIKRLYFLARDGEILLRLARELISSYGLEIEAHYLYVSRRSLHLPALDRLSDEDIRSLGIKAGLAFMDLMRKVGFDELDNVEIFLRLHGYSGPVDDSALSESEVMHLISVMRKEPVLSELARVSSEARSNLISYLRQERFFDQGNVGVVDIGWHGRLQRSLCSAARHEGIDITDKINGFYLGLHNRATNSGSLEAFLDDERAKNLKPFVRESLFEVFCAAGHGTTLAYKRDCDSRVVPLLAGDRNEEAISWGLYTQQSAINNFASDLLSTINDYGVPLRALENALILSASSVVRSLISAPRKEDASALGSFLHSSDQNHRVFSEIAPSMSSRPFQFVLRKFRRGNKTIFTHWREGSLARSFPSTFARVLILLTSLLDTKSLKA
jgi:predicted HAD superfamily hydrolase